MKENTCSARMTRSIVSTLLWPPPYRQHNPCRFNDDGMVVNLAPFHLAARRITSDRLSMNAFKCSIDTHARPLLYAAYCTALSRALTLEWHYHPLPHWSF